MERKEKEEKEAQKGRLKLDSRSKNDGFFRKIKMAFNFRR